MIIRTGILSALTAGVICIALFSTNASCQTWPQRPVRIIVPIGPGSAPDVAARVYGEHLAARWKQAVVVDNRPGADGLSGAAAFAATQDDHTLLFSFPAPMSVFPILQDKLPYDPDRDFVPISSAMDTFGVVSASTSVNIASLGDIVALARAQPGKLNWHGGGAFPTLMVGFAKTSGIELIYVPYREQNLALQDLAQGRIQLMITTLTSVLPLANSGKVRLLATTNKSRSPFAPEIPTVAQAGYPILELEGGSGFFGGRGMADGLRDQVSADIRAVSSLPAVTERLRAAGQIARGSTPAEFAGAIKEQRAKIASVVALIGSKRASP